MIEVSSEKQMQIYGERLGQLLAGGEVVELVGDVGAGKTTFVRGVARGMSVDETVQSPSFTISRIYEASDGRRLVHYDFYRLSDPGIMEDELAETVGTDKTAVVIEWANSVADTLPEDRLTISITVTGENTRQLSLSGSGEVGQRLAEALDDHSA
ncbi:MAG: tRNA (adenosine(37)-N6)-threonylcarbamoyltransferase complex ATPase subunit type 1 TsaE [Candidatus Nomurabacteria bacterium]|nr:MAG: tRNA (adenosine(37)-N6)-threonylcarbamoyltransferase complex ATPase subunit type 1 TsaE [Candidatus Nomurabacteria bacterium]